MSGYVIGKLYTRVKSGTIYTTNYALRESNEAILIFGASEVAHSLISNQISDSIGLTCYNLALDGQNITYQYATLNELLKRHKPKILILSTFMLNEKEKFTPSSLFPYYYDYPMIKNLIEEVDPSTKYKLLVKSYAYNSLLVKILQGNISNEPNTNGYKPIYDIGKNMKLSNKLYKLNITDKTLKYFNKFIQACKEVNCKVYVIDTPRYYAKNDKNQNIMIRKLLADKSVEYLDFAADSTFINHPEIFKDGTHLNHDGAKIFTGIIANRIKQDLNPNKSRQTN